MTTMNLCVWIGRRRSLWPSHRARRRHVDRDDSLARGIDRTLAQDERCWKRKRTTRREREREREDLRRRRAQRKLVMKKHPRSWHHSHHYHHHHHHHKFRVFLFCFQYLRPPLHTHTHTPTRWLLSLLSLRIARAPWNFGTGRSVLPRCVSRDGGAFSGCD